MQNKEPNVAKLLGIDEYRRSYTPSETSKMTQRLKEMLRLITKAEKITDADEFDELKDVISDIAWEVRAIEDAIDLIEEYEGVDFTVWHEAVEERLTDEEKVQFEQEKIMYKLKGE